MASRSRRFDPIGLNAGHPGVTELLCEPVGGGKRSFVGRFDVAEEDLPQTPGFVTNDVIGQREIDFTLGETEVRFDYYATSVAADLGAIVEVTKVTVRPRSDTHRVEERHIDLFVSSFNAEGVWQQVTDYTFTRETDGSITFTLPFPVDARYVKVHAHWNELDEANNAVDRSTFINDKDAILSVSYFAKNRDESYTYDAKGNRLTERVTTEFTTERDSSYSYYATSDRLKSDGIYGYRYDENGNLVEKGTVWTDAGDDITVDSTQGEYWRYEYDLLNRMIRAYELDEDSGAVELRVSYTYDFRGYRVLTQSVEHGDTRYTFDLAGMVLEESISGETINYIYAYARHLAKVEDYGTAEEETFFYLLDQVGTTVGITDESGALVWSADASPFGTEVGKTGAEEASLKYTGKDVDPNTGLYYFNARWYDATTGRFTTEDPIRDGWNWYQYVRANPLRFVDPTGLEIVNLGYGWLDTDTGIVHDDYPSSNEGGAEGEEETAETSTVDPSSEGSWFTRLWESLFPNSRIGDPYEDWISQADPEIVNQLTGDRQVRLRILVGQMVADGEDVSPEAIDELARQFLEAENDPVNVAMRRIFQSPAYYLLGYYYTFGNPGGAGSGQHSGSANGTRGANTPPGFAGRGSTANPARGSTLPRNLVERLAVEQARSSPAAGRAVRLEMKDPRWAASEGWSKMQQVINSGSSTTTVHYVYNQALNLVDDFKVIIPGGQ